MSKVLKSVLTLALIFGFTLTVALAGTQDQVRDKDQKKDGSCQEDVIKAAPGKNLAATQNRNRNRAGEQDRDGDQDQKRDRDRLKDGSCDSASLEYLPGMVLAADQTRDQDQDQAKDKDQLKDGSCQD